MKLNPYLTFDGTAREALEFYARVLNGTVGAAMTFAEMPEEDIPEAMCNRLAHGRVVFDGGTIMVSDTWGPESDAKHSGFSLQTEWPTVEAAKNAFEALSEGGNITMAFGPTFWAAGFGMCRDRFGVPWMVNCDEPA